jgi:hypothetical protein
MMTCAATEGRKKVAGEQLGHRTDILRFGEFGILHGALIACERVA